MNLDQFVRKMQPNAHTIIRKTTLHETGEKLRTFLFGNTYTCICYREKQFADSLFHLYNAGYLTARRCIFKSI